MAYRFVLEVPEAVHEEVKLAIQSVHDTNVLIERHPRVLDPDEARAELTVVSHNLDVIDAIYRWMADTGVDSGVYLDAHKGPRLNLAEYDPRTLRGMVQGDQYWFENTMPRIHYLDEVFMESGARVSEVPYGGRATSTAVVLPAETRIVLGPIDHVAIRVRNMQRAEAFYNEFFGMDVVYRARRAGDRWEHLDASFDWVDSMETGVMPEIVRLENGPLAVVVIGAGGGAVMHENRVAYISVNVPQETLNALRGRVLFASFTIQEDSPRAFRFIDPFGVTWQLVVNE